MRGELQKVRNEIKSNAMEMIKTNLDLKLTTLSNMKPIDEDFEIVNDLLEECKQELN